MALDILHDNWGPYTHTEVENALKAYLSGLEDRINKAIQSGGVGLTDLSQEVQALLAKANTALQPDSIAAWAKAQNKPGYTADEITGITGFQNLLAKLQDMDQKIQAAAQSGVTVDPQLADSGNPVANRAVKTAIDTLTNTLNTLIGSGNVQGAIDTFNEVVVFLNGINSSDTLAAKLALKANDADVVKNVSVETNGDGTVDINVDNETYTINLNHTHEGMVKLEKFVASNPPVSMTNDKIYVQVDNIATPHEIESLWLFGLEFTGGGAAPGVPYLSSPGANISMGDSENGSVTKAIRVKGRDLTQALSVALTGTGYTFGATQPTGVTRNSDTSLTITVDAAKAGVDIPVIYTGAAFNATATLSITSSSPDSINVESTLVANSATIENLAAVKLTGTQWLQTDYYPQANAKFELDCKFIKNTYSSAGTGSHKGTFLSCVDNSNPTKVFSFNNGSYYKEGTTNKVFSIYAWTENPYIEGNPVYSHAYGTEAAFCQRGVMSYSNSSFSFLGSSLTTETRTATSAHPLCIGYNANNGVIYGDFDLEIYELKLYNGTTLVYDFMPVIKDGVPGLLDAGTGTFISSETAKTSGLAADELVAVYPQNSN